MKFGQQFEFHKIPEWYDEYLDYRLLKSLLKRAGHAKLQGLYYLTKDCRSFRLDPKVISELLHHRTLIPQPSEDFLQEDIKSMQMDTAKVGALYGHPDQEGEVFKLTEAETDDLTKITN